MPPKQLGQQVHLGGQRQEVPQLHLSQPTWLHLTPPTWLHLTSTTDPVTSGPRQCSVLWLVEEVQ